MKLRNKKTGEICDFLGTYSATPYFGISVDYHNGEPKSYEYNSLAELNEEWEDVKKPLIEHDDARKAFFNWASTNQVHEVICEVLSFANGVELTRFIATEYISNPTIEFKLLDANVKNGGRYTISELCGDEE